LCTRQYRLAWLRVPNGANAVLGHVQFAGPDLREGKLGSCPGPPQLRGLHKKTVKKLLPKET